MADCTNSTQVAYRSRGAFASAFSIAAASRDGMLGARSRMEGGAFVVCSMKIAGALGPLNGNWPVRTFVESYAESVLIGAAIDGFAEDQLGRHVMAASQAPCRRQ